MAKRITKYLRNNVLGITALFIALGAGAYAAGLPKNSVKSKQIKAGAVKNAELADASVTSTKVEDGSLLRADFAAGLDADTLGGAAPASFKDSCPSGMTKIANTVCIDSTSRGGQTWENALVACGDANLRLPSVSEALLAIRQGLTPAVGDLWTDTARGTGTGTLTTLAVSIDIATQATQEFTTSNTLLTFCVTPPSDG
jgi:hypothetical protein